jgi:hypothetical protein
VQALVRRLLGELAERPGLARLQLRLEASDGAIEWLLDTSYGEARRGAADSQKR